MKQNVINSGADSITSIIDSIVNFGVLVVIAAIFLGATMMLLKRFIGTYSKAVDKTISEVIPKLDGINKSILDLNAYVNEMMTIHNARSNQSFSSLSKDYNNLKDTVNDCQKSLVEVESELKLLKADYDTIINIMINNGKK